MSKEYAVKTKSSSSDILPKGWLKVPFEYMAENISVHIEPDETDLDIYVGLEHLDSDSLRIKRRGKPDDVIGIKLHVWPGDIIFGKRRAYQRKVAVADFEGICSAHSMVLRARPENIVPELLPFFMQSEEFSQRAVAISEGSLSPTIKWKTLAQQEFIIPPKDEQRSIADILWAAEDYIVKNEKLADETELYKKILMKELLIHGDVKTLLDAIGMKKDLIVAGPFGSNLKVVDYKDEGIPIIRLQNIEFGRFINKDIKYISAEKANELNYHSFIKGDLVLAKLGDPIGKTCIIPDYLGKGIVVADVVRIRVNEQFSDKNYIMYVLNSFYVSQQLNRGTIGTTRPRVNLDQIRDILIPTPPLQEQRKIAKILCKLDETIQKIHENINKTKELKMKLINQFLNGGLETAVSINPQAMQLSETQVS